MRRGRPDRLPPIGARPSADHAAAQGKPCRSSPNNIPRPAPYGSARRHPRLLAKLHDIGAQILHILDMRRATGPDDQVPLGNHAALLRPRQGGARVPLARRQAQRFLRAYCSTWTTIRTTEACLTLSRTGAATFDVLARDGSLDSQIIAR